MSFRIPIKNFYKFPQKQPFYLGEESQSEDQPDEIKIQLKEHQKTSYCQIKSLEHGDGFYFINSDETNIKRIDKCNEYLDKLYSSNSEHSINHFRSNYWILSDKTGYGKTLTACCCLKDKENIINPITNLEQINKNISLSNKSFNIPYEVSSRNGDTYSSFKIKMNEKCEDFKINNLICFNTTLIIIPYGKVFTQWCETLDNYTSYNGIQIKNTKKILEEKTFYDKLYNIEIRINKILSEIYKLDIQGVLNLDGYKKYFKNAKNFDITILKNLFEELLEYKKRFDDLDYILIVNTFVKNIFEVFNKYINCVKMVMRMFLITKIYNNLYEYFNEKINKLDENLYGVYNKRGYGNKNASYINDIHDVVHNYMRPVHTLKGYKDLIYLTLKNVDSILSDNSSIQGHSYIVPFYFMFYRIIVDEVDTINLKGNYSIPLHNRYQKLGLLTATYEKLLEGNNGSNVFNSLIIHKGYSRNAYYPIILNDDKFLEKSFSMPVVNKKYLICDYNEQLADIMHNADYLESKGLLSSEVKELLNVNDFNGALKKMGATENSNDNIIDIICKDVLRNLKNKNIEKDMISQLDLEQNLKNARLATINKAINELEEKLNDLNSKFQDISIYDKLASKYGEDFLADLDEIYNEIDTMNITDKNKKDVSNIFDKYNIVKNEPDNAYLYEKVMSLINNQNKFCGICASVYRKPVLLNCSHIYCSECISQLVKSKGSNNCPLCRTSINFKKLCLIMTELKEETKEEEKEKKIITQIKNLIDVFEIILDYDKKINPVNPNPNNENNNLNGNDINDIYEIPKNKNKKSKKALDQVKDKYIEHYKTKRDKIESVNLVLNYIQNTNHNRKVLVFSNHQLITQNIKETIERKDLLYKSEIMTGIGTENCINRFKNKDSNLLFLSAKKNAAGIELPEGTDVILLHKMSEEIETQIIGRCMRMGRKEPLNVYYLYHDNEFDKNK